MKKLITENDVKVIVEDWYDDHRAWHYAPIQNGLGVHGIHDRLGCLPVTITPSMVGKVIGLLVSMEAKKPGRRGEANRGMTKHQYDHMVAIKAAGGFSICCDGYEDLAELDRELNKLVTV